MGSWAKSATTESSRLLTLDFPFCVVFAGQKNALRTLATESAVVAPEKKTGAGLWQRLTSFIVGAGLTGVFTQYYIFEEVKNGNLLMLAKQKELETRIAKLEKK
ncbi:predicted protein [Phaeodactylum tricornutum CCAP 1055/1]|jgi:hypothetical protein|uniref:Uncharacterized protein n=2 Tax=Phaeodactylum tricornutum TaxID=2850 RepID=B7G5S4_PHATC|nr:predicted protein [Phaeodactylum tricornutum CCAP 1055/1]EEC46204.1 predicted protein [Phaeodactylum tricornutum CCAP 1055/1]|eukprot:XP_002182303.1 predicted protein [Phaeodactylum tricornutum CCAP 1055/1]